MKFSRLYVVGDGLGWSIDDDRERLVATAGRLALVVLGVAAVAAVTLLVAGALLVAVLEFSQF